MNEVASRAVFLDRDGVINLDTGHVGNIQDFVLIAGVVDAMRLLQNSGLKLIVATNQSGIARGYYSEADFLRLTEHMRDRFGEFGITIDGVYYCPHHPEFSLEEESRNCSCRKPKPGMIVRACDELVLDPKTSFLVGDKMSDILAGKAAGIGTNLLVKTGHPISLEAERLSDGIFPSLREAAEYICCQS